VTDDELRAECRRRDMVFAGPGAPVPLEVAAELRQLWGALTTVPQTERLTATEVALRENDRARALRRIDQLMNPLMTVPASLPNLTSELRPGEVFGAPSPIDLNFNVIPQDEFDLCIRNGCRDVRAGESRYCAHHTRAILTR